MRLFGVQIHTVWSELNTLNSKPGTVFLGVSSCTPERWLQILQSPGQALNRLVWTLTALELQSLRLCLPRIYLEP